MVIKLFGMEHNLYQNNMEVLTNLDKINIVLSKYEGDMVKIWLFDMTHTKIALKITSQKDDEIIYLVMGNCQYIKGKFSWKNPQLSVSISFDTEHSENEYIIKDNKANFELTCNSGIALAKGIESEFGNSFDNFLTK